MKWNLKGTEIEERDLLDGDHIFAIRGVYEHHGIYFWDRQEQKKMVIHFTSASQPSRTCDCENGLDGVRKVCLNCFLKGCKLHRQNYGPQYASEIHWSDHEVMFRSDDSATVLHRATTLLQSGSSDGSGDGSGDGSRKTLRESGDGSGFGVYDLSKHNCEDFAIYCKTGFLEPKKGLSWQIMGKLFFNTFPGRDPHACRMREIWESKYPVDLERDCADLMVKVKAETLPLVVRLHMIVRLRLIQRLALPLATMLERSRALKIRYWLKGPDPSYVWPLDMLLWCYKDDKFYTQRNCFTSSGLLSS